MDIALGLCYPRTSLLAVLQGAQACADRENRRLLVRSMDPGHKLIYVAPCEAHPVDTLVIRVEPSLPGYSRAWQLDKFGRPYSNSVYFGK